MRKPRRSKANLPAIPVFEKLVGPAILAERSEEAVDHVTWSDQPGGAKDGSSRCSGLRWI